MVGDNKKVMPLFSVLIPLYNKERYLKECIDSILSQKCESAFEVVILDDGSIDHSREIADNYAQSDKRVRVYAQKNQGPLAARKQLLSYAGGEWCIFADADDYWKENLLSSIEKVIVQDAECDMVCFGTLRVYQDVEEKIHMPVLQERVYEGAEKKKLYEFSLNEPNMLAVWNKAFKKDIVQTDLYEQYKEMRYGEDRIQVLQMWKAAKKIVYLSEYLYCYRAMEGSLTQIVEINRFQNMEKYLDALLMFLQQEGLDTQNNLKVTYTNLTIDFLDSIFKYNTSKHSADKKKEGLKRIKEFDYYKRLEAAPKELKNHQKMRFYLLKQGYYSWLLKVDALLYSIKCIFVKRKVYGE